MINRNWLQVKRAIFKSAREVYVLADSSKFWRRLCLRHLSGKFVERFGEEVRSH